MPPCRPLQSRIKHVHKIQNESSWQSIYTHQYMVKLKASMFQIFFLQELKNRYLMFQKQVLICVVLRVFQTGHNICSRQYLSKPNVDWWCMETLSCCSAHFQVLHLLDLPTTWAPNCWKSHSKIVCLQTEQLWCFDAWCIIWIFFFKTCFALRIVIPEKPFWKKVLSHSCDD